MRKEEAKQPELATAPKVHVLDDTTRAHELQGLTGVNEYGHPAQVVYELAKDGIVTNPDYDYEMLTEHRAPGQQSNLFRKCNKEGWARVKTITVDGEPMHIIARPKEVSEFFRQKYADQAAANRGEALKPAGSDGVEREAGTAERTRLSLDEVTEGAFSKGDLATKQPV